MTAPVLWIWDKDDNLLYEGPFKGGSILMTGEAYRYKHLCHDGVKEGRMLTQEMIDLAIILDILWLEKEGSIDITFAPEETNDKSK
jgi:hypothetical protein